MIDNADLLTILTDADDRLTAVDGDGYIYDVETGEVIDRQATLPDVIACDADADAALEIRAEIDADIAAHDAKAKALLENLGRQRAALERRIKWWEWRFGSGLVAYARLKLRGKSRTVQFTWGRVSFRRTQPRRMILDMPKAVAWMTSRDPEKVKTVQTVAIADVVALAAGQPLDWLVESPEGENVNVETGAG